jgi:hypothetical protein
LPKPPRLGKKKPKPQEKTLIRGYDMTTSLTIKELSALDEQLGSEQLLVKRCRAAATACTDPTIKQNFTAMADRHQKHYDTLKKFLG